MPVVNCIWSYDAASEETRKEIAAGIERGLRRGAQVKARIHITFTDTSSHTPVIQIWWTGRPQELVDAACRAVEEEIRPLLPEGELAYYIFSDIKRGNFGANGEILNKKPDPERGIY